MKSNLLALLIGDAERKHIAQLGQLGYAQRQLDQAQSTAQMLADYMAQQQTKATPAVGQQANSQDLLIAQGFRAKLTLALQQQSVQVSSRIDALGHTQEQVNIAARRLRSVERLLQRRQKKLRNQEARFDQQQTDERASQIAIRKQSQ